ncbi:MAG TPA: hypothetical protein VFR24_20170 [Candidatus Angelobacter sp.]|nr:hypothetical protein [Candidatus Angelobacter sp.]
MSKQSELRFRSVGPTLTMDGSTTDSEHIASYPKGHEARTDEQGNIHIYRKKSADVGGITDTRPSKLRDALARLNQRNREFYARKEQS